MADEPKSHFVNQMGYTKVLICHELKMILKMYMWAVASCLVLPKWLHIFKSASKAYYGFH